MLEAKLLPSSVTLAGIVSSVMFDMKKALSPILLTVEGISIVSNASTWLKHSSGISVIPSLNVTFLRAVQR